MPNLTPSSRSKAAVDTAVPTGNVPEYSVSELSSAIKRALEDGFGHVRLKGEISGFRGQHASGHCYFGLKDDKAKIEAVIWKAVYARLRFKPEEGMEVIAQGRITTFPGKSNYQIVIDAIEPAGAGALMALLDERKRRLAAEGLFDETRRKARPFFPRVVGIVTAPGGAVIRDMLHGFEERFPVRVIIWPARMQGEGSAAEIARAIRGFNRFAPGGAVPRPDVLIVARGGGSLEDLWSFNDEDVVRAAAASDIPLISAVGHETDWTLIDLAADARAPTPTKAAEWAVPNYAELSNCVTDYSARQIFGLRRLIAASRSSLKAAARGLPRREDLIALPRQRFDSAEARLARALLSAARRHATRLARSSGRLNAAPLRQRVRSERSRFAAVSQRCDHAVATLHSARRRRLENLALRLSSVSYQSALQRGYSIVRDDTGRMVRSARGAVSGASLSIEFADGTVNVEVAPRDGSEMSKSRSRTPKPRGGQGSLF